MNEFSQIFETINLGLVILDRDFRVKAWNSWMEMHSGITAEAITGKSIYDFYPSLVEGSFPRIVKSVFAFGNYASYSQKLHKYLFAMENPNGHSAQLPHMQQTCTFGPLRNDQKEIIAIHISVQDVTDFVVYEHKLIQMTKTDGLTGMFNRRYLDSRIIAELDRCRRYNNPLSLMMIDIDHFKKINDVHGHLCGDYALRKIAEHLRQLVRTSDILGRYGGEEFCCVLPETSFEHALILAERCCSEVAASTFCCSDQSTKITISIGITSRQPDDTMDRIIKRADDALYQAKRAGRNRVCSSPLPVENAV